MSKIPSFPTKPSILPTDFFIVDDGVTTYKTTASALFPGTVSGITRSIVLLTTNTTLSFVPGIDVDAFCSNTITITLPTAIGNTNHYLVKNIGAGTVTATFQLGQTADGQSSVPFTVNESLTFISTGTNWTIN